MRQLRRSPAATKDPTSRNKDWRSCMLQLRPGTAKQIDTKINIKVRKHIYSILVLKWTRTQVREVLFPCLLHHFCQAHWNILVWGDRVWSFPCGSVVKNLPSMQELQETWVPSIGLEDPMVKGMATHSSILAWRIPWTEEPGGLQSISHKESDPTGATEHAHRQRMFLTQ